MGSGNRLATKQYSVVMDVALTAVGSLLCLELIVVSVPYMLRGFDESLLPCALVAAMGGMVTGGAYKGFRKDLKAVHETTAGNRKPWGV